MLWPSVKKFNTFQLILDLEWNCRLYDSLNLSFSTVVLPPFHTLKVTGFQYPRHQLFTLLTACYEEAFIGILVCISLMSNLSMFHVFIGHLYVAFAEMFISVFSLVFNWFIFSFPCKIFFYCRYKSFKDNWHYFFFSTCGFSFSISWYSLKHTFYFYVLPLCVFETGS